MPKRKTLNRKLRLGKQGRRTNWAPFWLIPKVYGQGKRIHPSRLTRVKRSWRRNKIQQKIKAARIRHFKSGRIEKKY